MSESLNDYVTLSYISQGEAALRLLLAALLAAAMGFEREIKGKPLGLRPFLLIGMGACLAVLATMELAYNASLEELLSVDPAKVIGGILGGIGFLGAGALFQKEDHVRGAATAASIWMTGVIGIACGVGYLIPAALATAVALLTLYLGRIRRRSETEKGDNA